MSWKVCLKTAKFVIWYKKETAVFFSFKILVDAANLLGFFATERYSGHFWFFELLVEFHPGEVTCESYQFLQHGGSKCLPFVFFWVSMFIKMFLPKQTSRSVFDGHLKPLRWTPDSPKVPKLRNNFDPSLCSVSHFSVTIGSSSCIKVLIYFFFDLLKGLWFDIIWFCTINVFLKVQLFLFFFCRYSSSWFSATMRLNFHIKDSSGTSLFGEN